MKKVIRTVWISLLSGLAFLVACTCTKGLSRAEKKQLKAERTTLIGQLEQAQQEAATYKDPGKVMSIKRTELELLGRLEEINYLLSDEEARINNSLQMNKVNTEIDSLQRVIDEANIPPCVYGPPADDPGYQDFLKEKRRNELTRQLEMLNRVIEDREGSCVYGSPEIIQRYEQETLELKKQAEEINKLLMELDNE